MIFCKIGKRITLEIDLTSIFIFLILFIIQLISVEQTMQINLTLFHSESFTKSFYPVIVSISLITRQIKLCR